MQSDEGLKVVAEKIKNYLQDSHGVVGDLSEHPITPAMEAYKVRASMVTWNALGGEGLQTPL